MFGDCNHCDHDASDDTETYGWDFGRQVMIACGLTDPGPNFVPCSCEKNDHPGFDPNGSWPTSGESANLRSSTKLI